MILLKPKRALATLLSFQIALFSTGPASAATLMSNSDVLRMLQNGSASEQIETQVCVAEPHFDVANRNALAAMGIPNKIIQLMILRQNGGKCEDTPSAARNPAGRRLALPQDSHRRPTYERTLSVTSTRHTSHLKPVGIVLLVAAGIGTAVYFGKGRKTGVCNVPSDLASDGSLCGGRAASERPGGH